MDRKQKYRTMKLIFTIGILFLLIVGTSLYLGNRYIAQHLLTSNENAATDVASIVANNFKITDKEVAYMKGLTFNEMEVDPINKRLMDIGSGVNLKATVSNVYLIAPLKENEIKYVTGEETSKFFGYPLNTKLDGVWLLNGAISPEGKFVATQREDIYRYTKLTAEQKTGMVNKMPFGEMSKDAWGEFITGYVPVYTVEGNFVGLLGIDFKPDKYQAEAQKMIMLVICAALIIALTMTILFMYFYFKYIKAKETELYFDFYSRMSHDLRTPMTGILGMVDLSREEKDPETLRHNFKIVEESGRYMLGLINDTLDMQKMDADKLVLDPKGVNLSEMINELMDIVRPTAEGKKVELICTNTNLPSDTCVELDELRTKQIFLNLLFNAVKFTEPGGRVEFNAEKAPNDYYTFNVKDNGIGMSKEFMDKRLFHPFEQENAAGSSRFSGTGLGLAIVKKLVDLMQGTMEVKSKQGKGTSFTLGFTFPPGERKLRALDSNENHASLSGKHILLCEDQAINVEIISKLLMKKGCTVDVAQNGQEGVELFTSKAPFTYDAILMDIRMPVLGGIEATKLIRSVDREDSKTIPVIAVTANAYDQDIELAMEAGFTDYLTKPVNPAVMYTTLSKAIKKK